jgi:hypothetical protein
MKIVRFMRVCMTFLCTLSLWNIPANSFAECCQQQDDCCYEAGCGWWSDGVGRNALLLGGAAIVGGVAGAIAGNSSRGGHRGHSSSSSRSSSSSTFVSESLGDTLTFNAVFTLTGASLNGQSFTVIPFVIRPNGSVVTGTTTVQTGAMGMITVDAPNTTVTVDHLLFGTYEYGVQVIFIDPTHDRGCGFGGEGITASFIPTVTASRDGGSTTAIGVPATLVMTRNLEEDDEFQTTVAFAYEPDSTGIPTP